MKNHAVLYLMSTRGYFFNSDDPNGHAIEIWMCGPSGVNHFLCNDKGTPALSRLTGQLYSAISENMKHPKVHKDIKNVIDAFMIGDVSDDEDIPF